MWPCCGSPGTLMLGSPPLAAGSWWWTTACTPWCTVTMQSRLLSIQLLSYAIIPMICLRIRVPKVLAMVITSAQLLQMVFGCGVNILAWRYKGNGDSFSCCTGILKVFVHRQGLCCQLQQPLLVLPDVHQLLPPVCQVSLSMITGPLSNRSNISIPGFSFLHMLHPAQRRWPRRWTRWNIS